MILVANEDQFSVTTENLYFNIQINFLCTILSVVKNLLFLCLLFPLLITAQNQPGFYQKYLNGEEPSEEDINDMISLLCPPADSRTGARVFRSPNRRITMLEENLVKAAGYENSM